MQYEVYILESESSGRYYIGSTSNIRRRVKEHNSGKVLSTRKGGPWKVVFSEIATSKKDAVRRELQIKKYKGGRAFKKLIQQ